MKNPFEKKQETMDQSVWADWLTDDTSNQKKAKISAQKPAPRPNFPNFTEAFKPIHPTTVASSGLKPLATDPHKFQDQQAQAFLKKRPPLPKATAKQPPTGRKEIAISIHLPAVSFANIRQWRPSRRALTRSAIACGLVLIVGLMVLTPKIINSNDKTASESSAGGTKNIPKSFAELKPESSQNVTNERYDESRGFYTFNDKHKGGNVTVTEQPLPDNVRDNTEKGKQLAQSVGATDDYETTHGMLYLTLSDTKKAQRAVLIHRQLLIFIQSTEPLDPTSWVDYVQSLQ